MEKGFGDMNTKLVTEIAGLKFDFATEITGLKSKIAGLKSDFGTDIAGFKSDLLPWTRILTHLNR